MPYEHYRIQAGAPEAPGIDGGIGAISDAPVTGGRPMAMLTIEVDNLNQVIASVETSGGRIVEPRMPLPGIGCYATCAEPGGLMFGVLEAAPDAKV